MAVREKSLERALHEAQAIAHASGRRPGMDAGARPWAPLPPGRSQKAVTTPKDERLALRVTKKLSPGQRGAVSLTRQFGAPLVCVRHREDPMGAFRYVTVELLVERKAIEARNGRPVGVRIDFHEAELRAAIKRCGATWDRHHKVWTLDRKTTAKLGLQDRIVMAY